jgi:hypothetical protein
MSENRSRSRSRSPGRHDDNGDNNYGGSAGGDDYHAHNNGGGESGVEEVKLYVGNLDYGKYNKMQTTLLSTYRLLLYFSER